MVHACQKYGKCASEKVKQISKTIKPKDAEDFARTKHGDMPFKEFFEKEIKKDQIFLYFRSSE